MTVLRALGRERKSVFRCIGSQARPKEGRGGRGNSYEVRGVDGVVRTRRNEP